MCNSPSTVHIFTFTFSVPDPHSFMRDTPNVLPNIGPWSLSMLCYCCSITPVVGTFSKLHSLPAWLQHRRTSPFILSYLMRIRCDATRPSNESTTFVILLRHYLHYNVNQHFQGRALQEAEGSFLRPATVKALCHTFFARGFAVLIKHSSSFNPHTRFLEHSAE